MSGQAPERSESVLRDVLVPAREGRGVLVDAGQILDIVDVEGCQVGDLVAFRRDDASEYMSPAHTVSCNASVALRPGDRLFSNHRNPVFTILHDDVGRHDIVVPCCDLERYSRDFGRHDHANCLANLEQGRALLGISFAVRGELAWNVFMHNRIDAGGAVVTDPAVHRAGSRIVLRAEMDLAVLFSACPQDLTPCNAFHPTSMRLVVRRAAA